MMAQELGSEHLEGSTGLDRAVKILVGMPASDSLGGPISSEPPFVEALRARGVEVITETYVYGDSPNEPTSLFQRVRRVLQTALRFRKLIRQHQPSIIFLNSAFDERTLMRDSVSLFVMNATRAKVFIKVHGAMADRFVNAGAFKRRLIEFLIKNVHGWGYHTREELEAFVKLGFDQERFYPVRNAITIHNDIPVGFERQQKEPDEIFELLFVARFVPTKGLIPTILACEELRKRGVRFRLTCVGDGEKFQEAKDTVGRLALGRVVTFTGHLPEADVTKHLLEADLFVFPTSHPEGFPNALFKAVATGLPIVTTKIRAAADYLSEPENCLYCTTHPDSIADLVQELIAKKQLRENMADANRRYGETLRPPEIADEFIAIFDKMLGKHSD